MAAGSSGMKSALLWSRSRSAGTSQDSETDSEEAHVPRGDEVQQLHSSRSPEALKKVLVTNTGIDLNAIEPRLQKAPIHSILKGNRSERNKLLETFLTYGDVDVNLTDLDGMYPLHLALKNNDIPSIKMLIAFGADVNVVSGDNQTPTELSKAKTTKYYFRRLQSWTGISVDEGDNDFGFTFVPEVGVMDVNSFSHLSQQPPAKFSSIEEVQAPPSGEVPPLDSISHDIPSDQVTGAAPSIEQSTEVRLQSLEEIETEITQLLRSVGGIIRENTKEPTENSKPTAAIHMEPAVSYNDNSSTRRLYKQLDDALRRQADETNSITESGIDEIVASSQQRKELAKFRKTGSRVLCLDGGGMKALVELDILESIERESGKKITELFDWIVGTSTGGILALGLVYAKKSIKELRRLCFQLKDQVFANPKFGISYNSEALEKMLVDALGKDMKMGDIKHPKVMVVAVYKGSIPLQTHLFNNCFGDNLSDEVVWKVARSTCAGPMLFSEFNNYVDGGVLCNNPTEKGVTAIQNYHWEKGEKLPISLIVSVGSGIYPEEKLGNVDVQDWSLGKMGSLKDRLSNLLDLFRNALVESETVAETCGCNFKEQGIPYYRFSPQLSESISSGETDTRKLIDSVITTRQQTIVNIKEMVSTHLVIST